MIVVGIDPGGAHTGIIVRRGDLLVWQATARRHTDEPIKPYLDTVAYTLANGVRQAREYVPTGGRWLLAVEGVVEPSPHVRITNVGGLLDTASVLGAVLNSVVGGVLVDNSLVTIDQEMPSVVVRPGGHGTGPMAVYPAELRPTRGRGAGMDTLRHCRSAWDISHAGERQWRTELTASAQTGGERHG